MHGIYSLKMIILNLVSNHQQHKYLLVFLSGQIIGLDVLTTLAAKITKK
jgi:hypothetical protein